MAGCIISDGGVVLRCFVFSFEYNCVVVLFHLAMVQQSSPSLCVLMHHSERGNRRTRYAALTFSVNSLLSLCPHI